MSCLWQVIHAKCVNSPFVSYSCFYVFVHSHLWINLQRHPCGVCSNSHKPRLDDQPNRIGGSTYAVRHSFCKVKLCVIACVYCLCVCCVWLRFLCSTARVFNRYSCSHNISKWRYGRCYKYTSQSQSIQTWLLCRLMHIEIIHLDDIDIRCLNSSLPQNMVSGLSV